MTAFTRAGSTKPVRKTERKFWNASSSATLKTGSGACLALSEPLIVNLSKALFSDQEELTVAKQCLQPRRIHRKRVERIERSCREGGERHGSSFGTRSLARKSPGFFFRSHYTKVVSRFLLKLSLVLECLLYSMRPGETPRGPVLHIIWSLDRDELKMSS